ncbi:ABC transporter ATP-binding protein [Paludibaculum fermentans]|uniref:ABC transporter ATP-binding protein n=1 Tax=Paludibaculum fermentans TaxID=1473598 RepID=A0A7S7NJS5_PALFE|nr:ABC transporter ATP-binding protein [Paludibaculum fermentans]QOY84897.1 ABC transporter ATP-binding protein [Paludibaculum fermentans]
MSSPLRTEQLTKRFRSVEALHQVSLDVPEGAVFALVGPNGAGKTTLLKTLLNIEQPTSGHAEVLGVDTRAMKPDLLARIGYISENQRLPGWMKTGYFLSYCKRFYPAWRDDDLAELIRLYQLPLDRKLSELSRGMRLKAVLASALAHRPKLILLDEPFSGLDVLVREQLIESILERTPEATVLLASHDLPEIESFASHVAYLNEGRLEFAEEMGSLTERFREVEVTLEEPTTLPGDLPRNWLNAEQSAVVVRFTDCRFDGRQTQAEVQRRLRGVRDVTARSMSLRAIGVALARSAEASVGAR